MDETDNLLSNQPKGPDGQNDYGTIDEYMNEFSTNKYIRSGFVKKVYSILGTQLLLTAFVTILAMENLAFKAFILKNPWLTWVCIAVNISTIIALCCIPGMSTKVPTNYILLFVFTLSESYMVGGICIHYPGKIVVCAAGLTAAMVLGLTLYAITTKTDFTMMGGMLFVLLMVLVGASIIQYFLRLKILQLILSICGVLLFGVYLIYDTQLIIGGQHKRSNQLGIDEYILAALNLYLDIINIFIDILQILGQANN